MLPHYIDLFVVKLSTVP